MTDMTDEQRIRAEAGAFRKLLKHLAHRTDVQNIDLMGQSGFCRNCLSEWYQDALAEEGVEIDKEAAREAIYGMPQAEWKAKYQAKASDEQLSLMQESLKKNEGRGF